MLAIRPGLDGDVLNRVADEGADRAVAKGVGSIFVINGAAGAAPESDTAVGEGYQPCLVEAIPGVRQASMAHSE